MRFLLDENVEYRLAAFLIGEGHDVTISQSSVGRRCRAAT